MPDIMILHLHNLFVHHTLNDWCNINNSWI